MIHERVHEVVVIGGGASGIGAAIRLRQEGITDFVLLEKSGALGGTWRDNTYPGCACDVPSALYSFSFAPNPEWTRAFAGQEEIRRYLVDVATRHGVLEHARFGVEVLEARWDEPTHRWRLQTSDGVIVARYVVAAAGPWHEPKIPAIPGLDTFPGEVFHSARWRHDVPLAGKRVAVVGSGASAVQFVPAIQPEVKALHLFQRTAQWVLPKPDHHVPRAERWLLRTFPAAQRALRAAEYGAMELFGVGFRNPRLLEEVQRIGKRHLEKTVRDPVLRAKLTPRYTLGCKRLLMSNTYYRALGAPNVAVHATEVRAIDGARVIGADGSEAEVDTIVLGTGFHILDMPVAERVFDGEGRSMAKAWGGSPRAYYGTTVTGFPNLFLLLGPNLGTGHSSAFTILEAQLAYVIDGLRQLRRREATRAEVRAEVQAAFDAEVQAALPTTVYNAGGCSSYYLDANGRNGFAWPWSTPALVRRLATFDLAAYDVVAPRVAASPLKAGSPTIDLRDAVVLVTGAGRGIGRATAEAFAREGARVVLGDRDEDAALDAAARIGARATSRHVDVADAASFDAFVAFALDKHGRVDVLVNNAGVMPLGSFFDASSLDRLTMDVNVWGIVHGMRAVLPSMIARGRGHVVNVASMAGKIPIPGMAMYNASKFAAVGVSAAVRREIAGTGVTVSAVLPAAVRTGLSSGVPLGGGLPTVDPEDIARAIVKSCASRRAEIPVPGYLAGWGIVDALVPERIMSAARGIIGERRALTSVDPEGRREYAARLARQAATASRPSSAGGPRPSSSASSSSTLSPR